MDINLPVTDGAASPKHRAEGTNQACITDIPTCTICWVCIRIHLHFPLPQDSGHGAVDDGIWRLTHPNKLPNSGLKYNWAYISDHKFYWWVGVTLKKKAENSCWQKLEKQSVSTIALGAEWLTPWAIPVTIQIMPRLTKTLSTEEVVLEIFRAILRINHTRPDQAGKRWLCCTWKCISGPYPHSFTHVLNRKHATIAFPF